MPPRASPAPGGICAARLALTERRAYDGRGLTALMQLRDKTERRLASSSGNPQPVPKGGAHKETAMPDILLTISEDNQDSPETVGAILAIMIGGIAIRLWPEDRKAYPRIIGSIVRQMVTSTAVAQVDAWESLIETFNDQLRDLAPWPAMELRPADVE
jgi:hypothetical protein